MLLGEYMARLWRGFSTVTCLLSVAGLALLLGAVGPALDGEPSPVADWQALQRFYDEHQLLALLILLLAGIVVGAGNDVTILAELYLQPRDSVRGVRRSISYEWQTWRRRRATRGFSSVAYLLSVALLALILGALGPALDSEPTRSPIIEWLASISDQDWCLIAVGGVLIWVTVVDAIGAGRARGRK